jgi:two-component system, chemotaxis family, protein-glutamate methylesterase/glutaminase
MKTSLHGYDLVAIGTSAGGFEAVSELISRLPADFTTPIAVVQHRSRDSDALATLLQDCTELRVVDAEDKMPLAPGVFIAPPDYHLLVDDGAFALSTEGLVGYSRPSIDVFFDSAADAYGPGVIGIVMTGANADGAVGLQKIVARGGQALVQDPATADVDVMPLAAMRLVTKARVMTIPDIADHLIELERLQHAAPEAT